MLILVDPHSGVPVYRQVMDQIRLQIATGRLVEGAELPSTRSLSATLKVNPMTVSKAYSLLEAEGVIERRPGLASVVRPLSAPLRKEARMEQLRKSLEPAVRLIRQLDLSRDEALAALRAMLGEAGGGEEEEERGEGE